MSMTTGLLLEQALRGDTTDGFVWNDEDERLTVTAVFLAQVSARPEIPDEDEHSEHDSASASDADDDGNDPDEGDADVEEDENSNVNGGLIMRGKRKRAQQNYADPRRARAY